MFEQTLASSFKKRPCCFCLLGRETPWYWFYCRSNGTLCSTALLSYPSLMAFYSGLVSYPSAGSLRRKHMRYFCSGQHRSCCWGHLGSCLMNHLQIQDSLELLFGLDSVGRMAQGKMMVGTQLLRGRGCLAKAHSFSQSLCGKLSLRISFKCRSLCSVFLSRLHADLGKREKSCSFYFFNFI